MLVADFINTDKEPDLSNEQWEKEGDLTYHIPLFEISHMDAQKIKNSGEPVFMKVTTSQSSLQNNVEVDLWYSSSLDLGLKLSDELAALSYSFKQDHTSKPLFTPRIATFSCLGCSEEFKDQQCLSEGAYCAYTPKFYD